MPVFNDREITLIMGLTGSLNKIAEQMPGLVNALQPTSNHQRQVAALKRQSEGVVAIDEIILYVNKNYDTLGQQDLILKEVTRQLKVLRKDLTG